MERINTYEKWQEKEGLPVIKDYGVPDLMAVPLKPWTRKGGQGAYINLAGSEGVIDAYLCEIPPGSSLIPQKHLYEELIYILSGYGVTTVWIEGSGKQTFEWQEGSLFAIPLNAWHQHFNGQSNKPVRYIGATRAPVSMNLFHDLDFIFDNNFVFKNRFQGEEGYFSGEGKELPELVDITAKRPKILETNFVADCRTFPLVDNPLRGLGTVVAFEMAGGMMSAHIAQFVGGTYLKAHYHGPGAHLICLSGQGYTLMWPAEGGIFSRGVERIKIDWQKNTVLAPPEKWFHQHFSTGKEPARQVAFKAERGNKFVGIKKEYESRVSLKLGGATIEFEDEDPEIRRLFKEELAKTGAPFRMSKYFPGE